MKWITRLFFGLLFALPFGFVSAAWVQADSSGMVQSNEVLDCQSCHPAFYEAWENSAHGQAVADPRFQEAWLAKGQPNECLACHTTGYDAVSNTWEADGITCQACHSPINENHPTVPMPTDRSGNLCGTCHQETLFEWQVSKHRSSDLSCTGCHGQHSTNLKSGDPSTLCASCHRDRASNFAHTQHSQEGLSCADCHLGPLTGEMGEGHGTRDHSFFVRLSTCNECHAYQMHDPVEVHMDEAAPVVAPAPVEFVNAGVSAEPSPVNPFSYALLSGLIGMAGGMILAPWLERWYKRFNSHE
jgi:hypothetical protein